MIKGLYLHIPFCKSVCTYCDFPKLAGASERIDEYVHALAKELDSYRDELTAIETLYLGGGTPSSIGIPALEVLFAKLEACLDFTQIQECTLEANPIDITDALAEFLVHHHVNRISLGVQTGHLPLLKLLGRSEGPDVVRKALQILRSHGIDNINLDFIYAIPSETLENLKSDIEYAISLQPKHLSFYSLILEERTKLYFDIQKGRIQPTSIDDEADQFEYVMDTLPKRGYPQYEISNYALPEFASKHNQVYWDTLPYLGLGMGAHSQVETKRFHNHATLQKYLDAVQATGRGIESFDPCELKREFGILGLRKTAGIRLKTFQERFKSDLLVTYPRLAKNLADGLLVREKDVLRLTRRGILVMNVVEESFME